MKRKIDNILHFSENFIILEVTGNDDADNKMIERMSTSISRKLCGEKVSSTQETYKELVSSQLLDKRNAIIANKDGISYLRVNGANQDKSNFVDLFFVDRNSVRNNLFLMSSINTKKLNDSLYRICYELANRYKENDTISIAVKTNIFCKNNADALSGNWAIVKNVFSAMEFAFEYKIEFIIYDNNKKQPIVEDIKAVKTNEQTFDYPRTKSPNAFAKSYEQSVGHIASVLGFGDKLINTDNMTATDIPSNFLNMGELMCEIVLPDKTIPAILSGAINALYHLRVDCTSLQVDAIPVAKIDKLTSNDKSFYVETTVSYPDAYLYILNASECDDKDRIGLTDELSLIGRGLFINHEQIEIRISDGDLRTVTGIKHMKILSTLHADFPTRQRIPKTIDNELYIKNMLNEYIIDSSSELAYLPPTSVVLEGYEVVIVGLKYYKLHGSKPKVKNIINGYKYHMNFIVRKFDDKNNNRFLFIPIDINGIIPTKWLEYPEAQAIISYNHPIKSNMIFVLEKKPGIGALADSFLDMDSSRFDIELLAIENTKMPYCDDLADLKPRMVAIGTTRVIMVGAKYYDSNKESCDNIIKSTNSLCGITNLVTCIYSVTNDEEDYIFNAIEMNGEGTSPIRFEPPRMSQVIVFNDTIDTLHHIMALDKSIFNKEDKT